MYCDGDYYYSFVTVSVVGKRAMCALFWIVIIPSHPRYTIVYVWKNRGIVQYKFILVGKKQNVKLCQLHH